MTLLTKPLQVESKVEGGVAGIRQVDGSTPEEDGPAMMAAVANTHRRLKTWTLAASLFAIIFIVWIQLGIGGSRVAHVFDDVAGVIVPAAACVACIVAAKRLNSRERRAWGLIGLGVGAWAAGEAIWVIYDLALGREMPFPSLADAGYLAFIPLVVAGLLTLPFNGTMRSRIRALVDSLIIVTSLLCLTWLAVLAPLLRTSNDLGLLGRSIAIVYPVGDLAIASIVIFLISRSARGARLHLILLGSGLLLLAFADGTFAYLSSVPGYQPGDIVDAGWVIAFLVIALAGVARSAISNSRSHDKGKEPVIGAVLPYVAVPVVLTLVAVQEMRNAGLEDVPVLGALVLGVFLVLRQALTARDNALLTGQLEQKVAQRTIELSASEELSRSIIDTATDAFVALDEGGMITRWSAQAEALLGWETDRALGRPLQDLIVASDQRERLRLGMDEFTHTGASRAFGQHLEVSARRGDGSTLPVEITMWGTQLHGATRFNAFIHDISQRKRLERELQHQALHDALTGLPNRELFLDRLEHALERSVRTELAPAMLFLDLDNFKNVNDSLGHPIGDRLLVAFAERLRQLIRPSDTVARFGGDEFAVLLDEASGPLEAEEVSKRIMEALVQPFLVDEREIAVTASIGIAYADAGATAEEMVRDSDMAMYSAKLAGKDGYRVFETRMHDAAVDRLEREGDLRAAVARGEFILLYQPIIELDTGRMKGAEALIRWNHKRLGLVSPGEFIGLAEETGLIVPLGRWVISEACRQVAAWDAAAGFETGLVVSVNISTVQFGYAGLLDDVATALKESGIAADRLLLEITESVMLEDSERAIELLQRLRGLGVRLAIDDFGTGYSSLAYIQRLPIDILKIDKSFVDAIALSPEDSALPHAMIKLAHALELDVTAEGVESEEQATRLRMLGCELGQGYLFSRPIHGEAIPALLVNHDAPTSKSDATPPFAASGALLVRESETR